MFIYSLRANTLKFFGVVGVAVIALITLIAFIPSYEPVITSGDAAVLNTKTEVSFDKIKTNEDRIAFLSQFGWEVDATPVEEAEVVIPDEFDKVFTGYNELQKKQGLDLSKYKRKKLMRYTYKITNYDGYNGVVYANILVKGKRVVGGDICSADTNGFIHGFSKDVVF
ncbi:MAG: DUF4830 domain-containing protein [Ruminococcaceae bacterium]|nr:DUF4830 domain-containing protein [Oscillospiraceae bacterium]